MPTTTYDVISVGSALRDVMYYTGDCQVIDNPADDPLRERMICVEFGAKIQSNKVFFAFGGGAANTSLNFAGLGLKTGVLSSTGFDLDGRGIKEHLEANKIDTSLLMITQKYRTGFSFLVVDEKSGEHSAYVYYGAARDITVTPQQLHRRPASWYYVSSLTAEKWRSLLDRLFAAEESRVAWNPGGMQLNAGYRGLKKYLEKTSMLILNRDEATELVLSKPGTKQAGTIRQMLRAIHGWGPEIVVITNSKKGTHVYDGNEYFFLKAPSDKPKDTTGAGDCYGSSFLAGYIRYNGNIRKSMQLAQKNVTSLVHSVGAQSGLLKWKELPKSLRKQG